MLQEFLDIIVNKNDYRKRLIGTGLELKFELLIANCIGRLRGINEWKKELQKFLENYPNSKESPEVKKMLANIKIKLIDREPIRKDLNGLLFQTNEIDLYKLRVDMISELNKNTRNKKNFVDSYNDDYSFIVVHTEKQYPEVNLLKIWSNLSRFQNNLDNFVILSSEYRRYKNKNLKPNTNYLIR